MLALVALLIALASHEVDQVGVQTFWSKLSEWQTLIAGLIGFGGLIWVNQQAVNQYRKQQDNARDAMISAMAVEINQICVELVSILKLLRGAGAQADNEVRSNQVATGLSKIVHVLDNKLISENFGSAVVVPADFMTLAMKFHAFKKDLKPRYPLITSQSQTATELTTLPVKGYSETPGVSEETVSQIAAHLEQCVAYGNEAVLRANTLVPTLNLQTVKMPSNDAVKAG